MNSSISVYTIIANQFTVYVGSAFFTVGIVGNLLNIGILYKNSLQNPSTLLLMVSSCFSFLFIFIGLLTRILSAGLNVDAASNSVAWCKMRFYLLQLCALMSVSSICYATIDQFFLSSRYERLRRLNKISISRRVVGALIVFWAIYSIPLLIFSNLVRLADGRIVCSFISDVGFSRYASYFNLPIVWGIIPLVVLSIFGILTYHNISLLRNTRHRNAAQRHLTSMILFHIILIAIGTFPYAFYYTYSAITINIVKSVDRRALESSLSNVIAVILYFPNSCSVLVYYCASATYRLQVKKFLSILLGTTQIVPERIFTLEQRPAAI